jgi:hypothetical protein
MNSELPADYKAAIKEAVSANRILIIGNRRCKLVSVDFNEGHIKCLPLYTNNNKVADIYETIPIQDIIKNEYPLAEGGSKSRKRLSRKSKGKKSYKKNKYSKTKKSRKFRRSIRSRR